MTKSTPIKTKVSGNILEVTIDRPKANAIELKTSVMMGTIFSDFRDNPDLRVAILTGSGEKFFCPGWDLKAAAGGDLVDGDYGVGGFGGLQELPDLNKPVIAAINGICCGGGLELALSCDLIIAAKHATFALPEINSGTIADAASIKLPKRIPYHIAMELLLTGRWLDSQEAHKWGFVNEIVDAKNLKARAFELAQLISCGPPLVMSAIKEVVRESEDKNFQDMMNRVTKRQIKTVDKLYGSEDILEGQLAFAEKRAARWKGR
jgi:crotonobetainyl-CoA hydratase